MSTSKQTKPTDEARIVLSSLKEADLYGFEIITKLNQQGHSTFYLKEGALYPILHSMEKSRYVKSYTKTAPNGFLRRYYRLTKSGESYLNKIHTAEGGTA